MSLIERYVADQTANGDPMVLDTGHDPARVICGCRSDEDADMMARALNIQEAIAPCPVCAQSLPLTRPGVVECPNCHQRWRAGWLPIATGGQ
jgi:hypothetical protein